jgi:transposase InsO family protein
VDHAQEQGMSERWACRLVNQPRGTQRYQLTQREDEDALTRAIVEFASEYGRYGYRRITALLKRDGWQVGKDRVERIWRRERRKRPFFPSGIGAGVRPMMASWLMQWNRERHVANASGVRLRRSGGLPS